MNKTLIVVLLAVIVLVAIGAFAYSQSSSDTGSAMMSKELDGEEEMAVKSEKMDKTDIENVESSRYTVYTNATDLEHLEAKRVLFFYASWCPTCRPADADFKANLDKIPSDFTVVRVNYNDPETDQSEKDLAKKYAVTYQHTYVQINSNGKEIRKWNGGGLTELLGNIVQ